MTRKARQRDQKPGWMLVLSLALHLVIFFIFTNTALLRAPVQEAPLYYVDLSYLPTTEPVTGTPAAPAPPVAPAPTPLPAPPPPAAAKPVMTMPDKATVTPKPKTPPTAAPQSGSPDQEAKDFADRLNRLERNTEAKHQAAALANLQKKAAAAKAGSPPGTVAGSGSDYGAYIQSRLRDALSSTIVYRSSQPETAVHLYIDKRGKLLRYVVEKPSADKLFNDSVIRAIEKAKVNFPPTPGGNDFDKLFVFSPQEVSKK